MSKKYVMRRLVDGKFFVKRRPNTGLGDLMTDNVNVAALYNHDSPMGFMTNERELWEAVAVKVEVSINSSDKSVKD